MAGKMRATRRSYRKAPIRRRRRTIRRKYSRSRSKYSRPDGYHSEKIVYNQTMKVRSDGSAQFYFTWIKALANGGVDGFSQSVAAPVNTDKQFVQCATMYREYRVTGVKFKYSPTSFNGYQVSAASIRSGSKTYTSDEPAQPNAEDIEGAFDNR